MPRQSPFPIELTDEQRQRLETVARSYTRPYIEVVQAKMVLYAADGLSNQEIAERLDTTRQIVSKWRKRFFDKGIDGLKERHRSGRPPQFPPLDRRRGQGLGL
jgi:transposase-like protein